MEHKIISATWKSKEALSDIISAHEDEGWSVAALGDVFGSNLLIFIKDGRKYSHQIEATLFKTKEKLQKIIADKEKEGLQVCAIGECFGGSITILKREI